MGDWEILGYIFCFAPPIMFFMNPNTNYVFLCNTLLCKKIARAPGVYKRYVPGNLGEGAN